MTLQSRRFGAALGGIFGLGSRGGDLAGIGGRRRGLGGRSARDILTTVGIAAVGGAAFEGAGALVREFPEIDINLGGRPTGPAVRPADVVIGGQGPVTFVKGWQAGEAIFAIDSEGKRWAWRPKLGIWKRTRVFNNIVISRKDVFRARRLIRTSKRLNAIRKGLR